MPSKCYLASSVRRVYPSNNPVQRSAEKVKKISQDWQLVSNLNGNPEFKGTYLQDGIPELSEALVDRLKAAGFAPGNGKS